MNKNIQTKRSFNEITANQTPDYRKQQRTLVKKLFSDFKNKREHNDEYLISPEKLKEALDDYEKLQGGYGPWSGSDFGIIGAESYYYWLQKTVNGENPEYISLSNQADEFAIQMMNEILFFELALSKISSEKQTEFLSSSLLEEYHHFLERKFQESQHLLSAEGEKIVNVLSKTSYENWDAMVEKLLSKIESEYEGKMITFEELLTLCSDQNEEKRIRAANEINKAFFSLVEVAENEINAILEYKKEIDKLRKFSYPEEASYLRDDIDKEVVEAMIKEVVDCNDISQQFYCFKAHLLWKKTLTYEEKNLSYGKIEKSYSFAEAVEIVEETIKEIDPEFASIFDDFLQNGKIDVYPQKGKRGGAFCTDNSKSLPVYIMLNYTGKLRDVSTLIHELGHGINAVLQRKQNALNYGAVISTAEVASTFFENLLIRKLSTTLTGEELLIFRVSVLDTMVQTIHRQVAAFRFEQSLHTAFREKGYLDYKTIGSLFINHMQIYMGDAIEFWEGSANHWIHWGHFRMFFYVYSYASGFLIAKSMETLLHDKKMSVQQIKTFLSAGMSQSPKQVFGNLWIDITKPEFRREWLKDMQEYLQETIQLAKSLGKIL